MASGNQFCTAFDEAELQDVIERVERRLDTCGYPYVLIIDAGGELKHVAGPGTSVLELLALLKNGEFLDLVAQHIAEEEDG